MSPPLISVIVVCRNPGAALPRALESVWAQRTGLCELVVIDGGSTDGTADWLGRQRLRLASLVSEPDAGVYDAMNKGLKFARGEWVLFLGADDRIASGGVFERVAASLQATDAGVVVGEARFDDGRRYPPAPTTHAIRRNFVHHQAAFYRRRLFEAHGHFDLRFRVMADYELNLRLLAAGIVFESVDLHIADCGTGGLSDSGEWAGYGEEIPVRHRYFPAWRCWPWDAGSVIRFFRKKIVRRAAMTRPE